MSDTLPPFRPFSNVQWYLAHSGNRVHLICACPDVIAPADFHAMVARALRLAPQLGWHESLERDGHFLTGATPPDTVAEYNDLHQPGLALGALEAALALPLANTGRPAFRARCLAAAAPDARGTRAVVVFEATHGVTEGGDIAALLRGRGAEHEARPIVDVHLRPLQRLAIALMLPLLWLGFLIAARVPRKASGGFRFARVALDRANVAAAARRLGVSQRALLFGLVLHATRHDPARRRRLNLAYSTLPKARAHLHDDGFLNVRMDEFRLRTEATAAATIRATAAAIAARGPTPIFVQAWQSAVLGWHRRAWRLAPWLYRGGFFGYSPYDLVLSLVPPLRPGPAWGALQRATCFAGSNSGTTPNCIFAVGPERVTLTLWADPAMLSRVGGLVGQAEALGIGAEVWD